MKILYALPIALLLAGCVSYSSTSKGGPPPPVTATGRLCVFAGQTYSPGARVMPANGPSLECNRDGNWRAY